MIPLPNPFVEFAAPLPDVEPPIPADPASADNRFDQHFDDLAFSIEITPRPFFMMAAE